MYRAPLDEIAFTMRHVAGLGDDSQPASQGGVPDLDDDLLQAILSEAGRVAADVLAPLNTVGDATPSRLEGDRVITPPGWREAYQAWCAGGWNALTGPEDYGGQDLPLLLSAGVQEMWNGANMAFALAPMLTTGAVEALGHHGADSLKAAYLEKMVSGVWPATMNLTEPQAGTDLGALRARAEPAGDRTHGGATYRIFGEKIFITYGEHDLAENIVHLVLARLPDAPPGTRGISLFLVPKFLPGPDGAPGLRNDLFCARLEDKLGIHASPTARMVYGQDHPGSGLDGPGAVGWLIGEPHRGLHCMFTMMNNARLMVGVQGVGIAEAATQRATAYALERRQGRAPVGGESGGDDASGDRIAAHPDVRRMLLAMRARTAAGRALCYACAYAHDRAAAAGDAAAHWRARGELLTPVAKAYATDCAFEAASLGVQVHGGMGYIEEAGAAQYLRDARIAPIYEGTNGVQAVDLVTRKLALADGGAVAGLIADLRGVAERVAASNRADFGNMGIRIGAAIDDLEKAGDIQRARLTDGDVAAALAVATPYLRLFGIATGAGLLARGALATPGGQSAAGDMRIAVARAFAAQQAPASSGLCAEIRDDAEAVLAAGLELLGDLS